MHFAPKLEESLGILRFQGFCFAFSGVFTFRFYSFYSVLDRICPILLGVKWAAKVIFAGRHRSSGRRRGDRWNVKLPHDSKKTAMGVYLVGKYYSVRDVIIARLIMLRSFSPLTSWFSKVSVSSYQQEVSGWLDSQITKRLLAGSTEYS